uniref:SIR2 family protein n=1 Tax=Ruminococcus bromii TaxID=40518 RepID=UPI003FEDBC46
MIKREEFVKKFAEKCKNNSAAIFLGAGMSVDAGLPSWKNLFLPLAEEMDINIENTKYQIYDIAQFYANRFGTNELYKKVGKEINRILVSSKALDQLSLMQCNSIWTTNFDQVLENNLSKIGKITNIISKESDLIGCDLNKNVNIFKLNGDIRDIQNAVITKSDLEKYHENHHYYLAFFKRELITKTFLFLGYSFTDSLVLPCISELGRAFNNNQPHHFTIIKNSQSKDFKNYIADLENRYQIDVLLIDDYNEISEILTEINYYTNQRNVFISGSYQGKDEKKLYEIDELCKIITRTLYNPGFTIVNWHCNKIGYD